MENKFDRARKTELDLEQTAGTNEFMRGIWAGSMFLRFVMRAFTSNLQMIKIATLGGVGSLWHDQILIATTKYKNISFYLLMRWCLTFFQPTLKKERCKHKP